MLKLIKIQQYVQYIITKKYATYKKCQIQQVKLYFMIKFQNKMNKTIAFNVKQKNKITKNFQNVKSVKNN